MKKFLFWATFVFASCPVAMSQAALIASDSFSTEGGFLISYTPGSIADEAPIEGCIGFMGGWSGGTAAFVVADGGLTHPLTPGRTWNGRLIAYTSSGSAGGGGARNLGRLLTSPPGSGTYYMSVLLQKNAATSSRDFLAGLSAENPATAGITNVHGSYVGFVDGGISFFATGAQIWQLLPDPQVNVNETYFALLRYDYSTSGPDTVTATIYNGVASQVAQQTIAGLALDGTLTDFGVLTQDFGPMVAVDEWRLGTEVADVMVQPRMLGDFDDDGDCDGADFLVWQRGGSPNPLTTGDLADWHANFGMHKAFSERTPIPEPSSLWLVLGLAAFAIHRRV